MQYLKKHKVPLSGNGFIFEVHLIFPRRQFAFFLAKCREYCDKLKI